MDKKKKKTKTVNIDLDGIVTAEHQHLKVKFSNQEGFLQEAKEHVFDAFYKENSSLKAKVKALEKLVSDQKLMEDVVRSQIITINYLIASNK